MGFSVAGTWALEAAAGETGAALRAAVSLGGYGDYRRMLTAMVTGEHEWHGRTYHYTPDPYGRWIVAADLLPRVDSNAYGTQEEREVAGRALHRLARTAGRNGALAGTPTYDRLIEDLRRTLPAAVKPAWEVLAPPSKQLVPDPGAGRALADALATAGLDAHPELDPTGRLDGLAAQRTRVILLHGRQDTLIPFTETLRLASLLPHGAPRTVALTRLIGHAKAAEGLVRPNPAALVTLVYEVYRFAVTMRRIIGSLDGAI
jgi:pimeloyl-ACP methyl ester carboxylesterase